MRTLICSTASAHQGDEPAATANLELTKNAVQMFLDRFQTQAAFVSNFLIAPPVADQSRQLLFSSGQLGEMRQGSDLVLRVSSAQVFKLDQKMRPGHAGRADLLQTNDRAKMASSWMMN